MNKKIKAKWLEALRSGRYKQGTGVLQDNGNFCCIGVLCDLHSKEFDTEWEDNCPHSSCLSYDGNAGHASEAVCRWAELPIIQVGFKKSWPVQKTLATMNDRGESFSTIADFIEQNF